MKIDLSHAAQCISAKKHACFPRSIERSREVCVWIASSYSACPSLFRLKRTRVYTWEHTTISLHFCDAFNLSRDFILNMSYDIPTSSLCMELRICTTRLHRWYQWNHNYSNDRISQQHVYYASNAFQGNNYVVSLKFAMCTYLHVFLYCKVFRDKYYSWTNNRRTQRHIW